MCVDGCKLPVTKNLLQALRRLRGKGSSGLWVDAVCINQDDLQERTEQVLHVTRTYYEANGVTVWLGEDSPRKDGETSIVFFKHICESYISPEIVMSGYDETTDILQRLDWTDWDGQRIASRSHASMLLPEPAVYRDAKNDFEHRILNEINRSSVQPLGGLAEALGIFWERPWFFRKWVIQEIYLSRRAKTICGASEIELFPVMAFISTIYANVEELFANHSHGALRLLAEERCW